MALSDRTLVLVILLAALLSAGSTLAAADRRIDPGRRRPGSRQLLRPMPFPVAVRQLSGDQIPQLVRVDPSETRGDLR